MQAFGEHKIAGIELVVFGQNKIWKKMLILNLYIKLQIE